MLSINAYDVDLIAAMGNTVNDCISQRTCFSSKLIVSFFEYIPNGVKVYHYLTYLLEKLPNDRMSDEEIDCLALWNEEVKSEIERRANDSNQ